MCPLFFLSVSCAACCHCTHITIVLLLTACIVLVVLARASVHPLGGAGGTVLVLQSEVLLVDSETDFNAGP